MGRERDLDRARYRHSAYRVSQRARHDPHTPLYSGHANAVWPHPARRRIRFSGQGYRRIQEPLEQTVFRWLAFSSHVAGLDARLLCYGSREWSNEHRLLYCDRFVTPRILCRTRLRLVVY